MSVPMLGTDFFVFWFDPDSLEIPETYDGKSMFIQYSIDT